MLELQCLRAITVSGNNVHVVWHDFTPGNFDILFRSTDGGASFTEPTKNLSNNAGDSDVSGDCRFRQ